MRSHRTRRTHAGHRVPSSLALVAFPVALSLAVAVTAASCGDAGTNGRGDSAAATEPDDGLREMRVELRVQQAIHESVRVKPGPDGTTPTVVDRPIPYFRFAIEDDDGFRVEAESDADGLASCRVPPDADRLWFVEIDHAELTPSLRRRRPCRYTPGETLSVGVRPGHRWNLTAVPDGVDSFEVYGMGYGHAHRVPLRREGGRAWIRLARLQHDDGAGGVPLFVGAMLPDGETAWVMETHTPASGSPIPDAAFRVASAADLEVAVRDPAAEESTSYTVALEPEHLRAVGLVRTAEDDGTARFPAIPPGRYTLVVRRDGEPAHERAIDLEAGPERRTITLSGR